MTALYAQLESLTTTVAQLRREAPRKAASEYAAQLRRTLEEEDEFGLDDDKEQGEGEQEDRYDEEAMDEAEDVVSQDKDKAEGAQQSTSSQTRARRPRKRHDPTWTLQVPMGTEEEAERWQSGDMAAAYENALRMLLRLQGEEGVAESSKAGGEGNALATTVGKAERAGRAAEVVEKM